MMSIPAGLLEATSTAPMHIPDGFLSTPVSAAGWAIAVAAIGVAARQADRTMNERAVPLMGVMAAFIFATQMMNFPVAGGTSGHLLGGALAAILLGPWAAIIVMAAVIGLQALLFQDGGLVVLGANIANMGLVTVAVGALTFRLLAPVTRMGSSGYVFAAGLAAWLSVVASAIACAVELGLSDTSPLSIALPAMVGVHVLIGLGEAAITVAALSFIRATNPGLLRADASTREPVR